MDGVAISIIGRPRPLPGHDTPNAAHNTYTLKCEEPVIANMQGTPEAINSGVPHAEFTAPMRKYYSHSIVA